MTALHCAALSGYSHTLNTLLEKGANPLVTNNWDQYPIHSALVLTNHDRNLIQKKIDLFKCLQQRAPETIYKHDKSGNTVFHFMSIDDRFHELMSELLHDNDSGAKIFNKQLQYPIHCSILNNQTQSVKLLLAIDEVSSLKDSNDEVAAHHAARSKNSEIMNACFDSTQDLDIKNNNGETPLIIASKSENLEAIKILVEKGAHLHEEDEQGHSFIYYANESHSPDLIHWLEEQGIREHVRPGN
jgi:ankyrin repeat protein